MIQCAYPLVALCGVGLIIIICIGRFLWYRHPVFTFSLTHAIARTSRRKIPVRTLLSLLRISTLLCLLFAAARIRKPDERTKLPLEGIDIMLVLDVSGSMEAYDDPEEPLSRFRAAQKEAMRFVERRSDDAMGLVIFAAAVASRCPLTADRKLLTSIIHDTQLGILNPNGTLLSMAIATAANRLRSSKSPSKIMIVLSDGAPTQGDLAPQRACDLAKKLGVKIYTIGVGAEGGVAYMKHPMLGLISIPSETNFSLLGWYAQETGGKFFRARDAHELEAIYATIDALEKRTHESPLFAQYHELGIIFLWCALCVLLSELILKFFVWRLI